MLTLRWQPTHQAETLGKWLENTPLREGRARHLVGIIFLDESLSPKNKWGMPKKRACWKIRLDLKMIKNPRLRDRRLERNDRTRQENDQRPQKQEERSGRGAGKTETSGVPKEQGDLGPRRSHCTYHSGD